MVFHNISKDLKETAIASLVDMHAAEVASQFQVSQRSLSQWLVNLACWNDVEPPPSVLKGRPRTLDHEAANTLSLWMRQNPIAQLDEIQLFISVELGKYLSRTAIHYNIHFMGFTNKRITNTAIERNEEAQVTLWWSEVRGIAMDFQLVFTDQPYFDDHTGARKYGYSLRGEECFVPSPFCCGERFTVNPALSIDGFIALDIIEGSMNAACFHDFIVLEVVGLDLFTLQSCF